MTRPLRKADVEGRCPCGGGRFMECCGPLLDRLEPACSAARLMRSRYTAYARGDEAYLLDTWHPATRPPRLDLAADPVKWIGLEVRSARSVSANRAEVEFVARYRAGGRAHRLHETSRFERVSDRWYYLDGDIHAS